MIKHDMIIFLEDLKNLLQETELEEKENEVIIEVIDLIDDKGTFESDDEVGFFFTEIQQLGQDLENLFETEVEDAPIKEKKKKEK